MKAKQSISKKTVSKKASNKPAVGTRKVGKLPGFVFRDPSDNFDTKLLADVRSHGWHVLGIPDDDEGPGFSYSAETN